MRPTGSLASSAYPGCFAFGFAYFACSAYPGCFAFDSAYFAYSAYLGCSAFGFGLGSGFAIQRYRSGNADYAANPDYCYPLLDCCYCWAFVGSDRLAAAPSFGEPTLVGLTLAVVGISAAIAEAVRAVAEVAVLVESEGPSNVAAVLATASAVRVTGLVVSEAV